MQKKNCVFVEKGLRLRFETIDGELYFFRKPCCYIDDSLSPKNLNTSMRFDDHSSIFDHESIDWYKNYFNNNDNLPSQCISCISSEERGLLSHRIFANKKSKEYEKYDISRLDVVLGNKCNLACVFCTPAASSLIETISKKMDAVPFTWDNKVSVQPNPEKLSHAIADILTHYKVHTLKIIGGEPFLKENWSKLEETVKTGIAKNTTLEITTNGTIMNSSVIESLSSFKTVFLSVSVDSIGKNYDFIRWPHKWHQIEKNLQFLKLNAARNIKIKIYLLVNILNLEFLPFIERYFDKLGLYVSYGVDIKPANHPLNYKNISSEILQKTISKIRNENLKQKLETKSFEHSVEKEEIKRQLNMFYSQRKMNASSVLGPMTYSWLYE
jgi:MoaA/NifB/PqqE/SkfB family radical SAM enzyme